MYSVWSAVTESSKAAPPASARSVPTAVNDHGADGEGAIWGVATTGSDGGVTSGAGWDKRPTTDQPQHGLSDWMQPLP